MIQDLALGVLFPLIGEELIAAAALKEADAIWEVSWSEFMNRDYRNVVGHVAHHAHETLGTQALHHVGIKTTEMAAGKGLQAIGEGARRQTPLSAAAPRRSTSTSSCSLSPVL